MLLCYETKSVFHHSDATQRFHTKANVHKDNYSWFNKLVSLSLARTVHLGRFSMYRPFLATWQQHFQILLHTSKYISLKTKNGQ
jgi:hypothetical protein